MSVIKTFPDRYINKFATILLLDEEINKMLYYNEVLDKDIYSLPSVENPISELKDNKLHINRRVQDLFKKHCESEAYIFINLYSDSPCFLSKGRSRFIDTLRLDVGVVCADGCCNTLNGYRTSIIFNRIVDILNTDERLMGIGKPSIYSTKQNYAIPLGYNAYIITVEIDYFGGTM